PLLGVDLARLLGQDQPPEEPAVRVLREARLRGAALLLGGVDTLLRDDRMPAQRGALLEAIAQHDGPVVLALDQAWEPRGALRHATYACVDLPPPSFTEREQLWQARLNGSTPDPATLETLASAFRLSGGQIRDASVAARDLARARGP